ncbi:MAG TPA: hypothetical protein VKR43_16165 [Bryobacteraceae bacterium]|nr:hypothetical protein [Bryobacteraceae bacterium]
MRPRSHYRAWLLLCAALAVHIADEALTGFLGLYNPAVLAIRERRPWLILPTFTFPVWISLLGLGVIGLLILSHWVKRRLPWTAYASYAFAGAMIANGIAHLGFSIYKAQWMSGAYTSPVLLAAALNLLIQTSARQPACNSG